MVRTIDANLNRICEGLRVIEDFLRFELEPEETKSIKYEISFLKDARHFIRENIQNSENIFLKSRDSANDTGKKFTSVESNRSSKIDLVQANFYRIQEGLRVLEESAKINNDLKKFTSKIKELRFQMYTIEKKIIPLIKRKLINLNRLLIIDLDNYKVKELKTVVEILIKSKITCLALSPGKNNLKIFLSMVKYFKTNCKTIPIFIINNLDIALISGTDGILLTADYIPINEIKKVYDKNIGFIINEETPPDFLIDKEFYYIFYKNAFNAMKFKKIDHNKKAIQVNNNPVIKNRKLSENSALFSSKAL